MEARTGASSKLPSISVITPSYNQGAFIETTMRSVLDQGYPELEYIIQDSVSKDATAEVLTRYSSHPQVQVYVEKDRGQTDGLNRGFSKAHGEVIGWLNSDDLYTEGTLQRVGEFFRDHPEADLVYGDSQIIDAVGAPGELIKSGGMTLDELLVHQQTMVGTSYFFRRRVFDAVGYLDDSLHYSMDYEFWIRLSVKFQFHYLPVVLSQFRIHPASKTSSRYHDTFLPEVVKIMRRYRGASAGPLQHLSRWIAQGQWASWWYWEGAWDAHRSGDIASARRYARTAGMVWPPSVIRYHRMVEFVRGCLAR